VIISYFILFYFNYYFQYYFIFKKHTHKNRVACHRRLNMSAGEGGNRATPASSASPPPFPVRLDFDVGGGGVAEKH
jgi:hypothetical protein